MKISPIPATLNPQDTQAPRTDSIRTLKMSTDATPEWTVPPEDQKLIIPDNKEEDKSNPAVEATEPISPQFAALAKQRRALQQERRAFIDEKKAFDVAKQGSSAVDVSRLKSEPLKVLLEAGVTFDQLTQEILANQANPEVLTLKAEMSALKEGVDKKFQEEKSLAEQAALVEIRREADRLSQGDEFELVRETKSIPQVLKLIERTFREKGELLDTREALKLVEDELLSRQQRLVNAKKLQGLFNKQPDVPVQQRPTQGMRTLTNKDTASQPMSARQRAVAAFYGTLKK